MTGRSDDGIESKDGERSDPRLIESIGFYGTELGTAFFGYVFGLRRFTTSARVDLEAAMLEVWKRDDLGKLSCLDIILRLPGIVVAPVSNRATDALLGRRAEF